MRMLYHRLLDAKGMDWKVYIVDDWVYVEDDRRRSGRRQCYGATDFDRREIELTIRQTWRTFQRTFVHEVGHAALGVRRPEKWDRAHEEKVIKRGEGSLLRMMRQLGMRVPPLPKGVRLRPERRCRRAVDA